MYHQTHIPINQSVITTLISIGVLVMAIGLGLMMAMPVHAAGTVSTCNETNVDSALTSGGTITFTCSGTITLTTVKSITANTIIDGTGQTVTLTASVNSVFTIGTGQSLTFKNLTLTLNGQSPVVMTNGGNLTLDTVTVQNSAPTIYGVFRIDPAAVSHVTFTNSQFKNNTASGSSSGVITMNGAAGSTLTINGCLFDTNYGNAGYAGALVLQGAVSATISNSQFLNNRDASSGIYGGAIGWGATSTLNITGSTFQNNTAGEGGAIKAGSGTIIIDGSTFTGNTAAAGNGGAISISGSSSLTVTNGTFTSNQATAHGGALLISSGVTSTISTTTFTSNRASTASTGGDGGAIHNQGTLTINDSTFTNNQTLINSNGQNGGALHASGATNMTTINRSTFSGNSATHGGAIFVWGGSSFSLSNSTITGNTAGNTSTSGVSVGGGISLYSGLTTATIKNVTVANNTVSGSGGGGLHSNATTTLTLYNSILANNTGSGNLDCYLPSGTLSVNTNNLIMNGNCGSPAVTANPLLGTLANNGGTTQTLALLAGSPALDAGDDGSCLSPAQNGVTRPRAAHCDIGAYEMPLYTLTLAKNGTGTGTVSSSGTPVGTSCGTDCLTYLDTTAITLTATADPGSVFTGWSPASCVTGMTLTANTTCTATFMPGHNLTLATDGTGTGTGTVSSSGTPAGISCGANCLTYLNITAITLTATPGNNSTFAGWSPATCVTGMTINADTTCTATFNLAPPPPPPPLPEYLGLFLRLDGTGSGKVTTDTGLSCQSSDCQQQSDGSLLCNPLTCSQAVRTATTVTLTPQADLGSYFSSWGGHPDCLTSPMLMDSGKLCIAYFHLLDEPLTVVIAGQGNVIATPLTCPGTCTANYPYGTTVTLQTQPAPGWKFQAWSGDCSSTGQILMTSSKTCGATFMLNPAIFDEDLDHIPSAIEDAAPNHGDGNGDGIPDSQQNNVASFVDLVSGKYITLQVDKACPITNVYGELPDKYPGVDRNHHFPQGLTYFELSCAKTQVTVYYHGVHKVYSNLRFYKYGPTVPGDLQTVGWYKYPATFAVVQIGGQPVMTTTYTLIDGQLGDSTGVDGKIVDPAGIELE